MARRSTFRRTVVRRPGLVATTAAATGTWALALTVNRSLRRARGDSMVPTLRDGQTVLVVPVAVRRPRVGDVVVARDPRGSGPGAGERPWIKRVGALGPASVEVDLRDLEVPAGRVLLLGDNRAASTDGRHVGPTPLADVTHVVVWPRLAG